MSTLIAGRKSNSGTIAFAAAALVLATVLLAWHSGIFGSAGDGPELSAPPAVVETPEERRQREQVEDIMKSITDQGDGATGSS